jgi:hypothetical protein
MWKFFKLNWDFFEAKLGILDNINHHYILQSIIEVVKWMWMLVVIASCVVSGLSYCSLCTNHGHGITLCFGQLRFHLT